MFFSSFNSPRINDWRNGLMRHLATQRNEETGCRYAFSWIFPTFVFYLIFSPTSSLALFLLSLTVPSGALSSYTRDAFVVTSKLLHAILRVLRSRTHPHILPPTNTRSRTRIVQCIHRVADFEVPGEALYSRIRKIKKLIFRRCQ